MERADFIKATELTGAARTALNPNNKRNCMILPTEIRALPKGIIYRSSFVRVIPVDIFIARVCLDSEIGAELFTEECSRVLETRGHCDSKEKTEIKRDFHLLNFRLKILIIIYQIDIFSLYNLHLFIILNSIQIQTILGY
jgi:hypothetical protein